ncbi:hypothetical protein BKA67DRAFT_419038 [Truncatella angustata]|uniref:DUF7730 domain-containing protein n=1 Tax=Truncatella angustata TaxID=152316 RepID=A0A9P8UD79_9PEZI|nr:uncharacterized protein BKA67DRAFT_419038 [Truncatella angustata]KAH6646912.1 hypothetical protein BKA67DRAFT_419038 [Truncatella angustata]
MMSGTRPQALTAILRPEPQPSSLFLTRLVPEIRSMIYGYIVGEGNLHIFVYEQNLVTLRCLNPASLGLTGHETCIGMPNTDSPPGINWKYKEVQERTASEEKRHVGALLTVCRTIYLESVDTLYRTHILHFNNMISITTFPRAMIPRHLEALHHVRLFLALHGRGKHMSAYFHNSFSRNWPGWDAASAPGDTPWASVWAAMAELKSLHTLVVTLELKPSPSHRVVKDPDRCREVTIEDETLLLDPTKEVTCNDFLLRVNWPSTGNCLKKYPFRIERYTQDTKT